MQKLDDAGDDEVVGLERGLGIILVMGEDRSDSNITCLCKQ